MKKRFTRAVAMLLLLVMVVGFLPSNLSLAFPAKAATPSEATQNLLNAADYNYNFQTPSTSDATKPAKWTEFYAGKRDWFSYSLVPRATGDSALKVSIDDKGLQSGAAGTNSINALYSEPINVENYVGKNLMVNIDAMSASTTPGLQIFLCFYTNTDTPAAINSGDNLTRGDFNLSGFVSESWSTASTSQRDKDRTVIVPTGAKYARVFLYFSCKVVQEICIDNVVVKAVCADDAHTYTKDNVSTAVYRDTACETRYYKRCDNCDFIPYLPEVGVEAGTSVGRFSHTLPAVAHKAATATATGNIAYWTCGACSKWFRDSKANVEITDQSDVIIAKRYSNLMANADYSFENTAVGEDPASWTQFADTNGFYEVSDQQASMGSKSLKMVTDETSRIPTGIYGPVVPIADIKTMSLLVDVYGDSSINIYLYFYDGNMNQLSLGDGVKDWFEVNTEDKWQVAYRKYNVPADACYAQVLFYKSNRTYGTVYLDNLVIKEFQADDEPEKANLLTDSFENGAAPDGLPKGWTYVNDASRNTADKKFFEIVELTGSNGDVPAAKDGTHALKFTQVAADDTVRGAFSPYIDVSGMQGVLASLDIYGASTLQIYVMFYDEDYNCPENTDWRPWAVDDAPNEWGQLNFEAAVPKGAKYARLCIYKSKRPIYDGTTYIDKIVLKETTVVDSSQVQPDVPEYVEYEWQIVESEHPRVYFDAKELRRLKKSTKSDTLNSMGYTGASAYAELIAAADGYLAETFFRKSFGSGSGVARWVEIKLYPKMEDLSIDTRFHEPPNEAFAGVVYPYFSTITDQIMVRMKTLSLAYALSGDVKYAERAIQYAMDMSNWTYWEGDLMWQESMASYGEFGNQGLGYCIRSVATVYDMCYELLTPQQRKTMENAIITKGLEHIYSDSLSRMTRGKDFDIAITPFLAVCAIINEDNKDELGKYLDRAMQYTQWIFDWYESGHNEGYSYANESLEQMFEGLAILERVTGTAGMLEHPFAAVTLPNWIKGFIETYSGTMPGYRDSDYHITYFPIILSTLAKRGDTAAGFCLHRTGGGNTAFDKLVYTNISDDYIWPPEDDYMNVTVLDQMGIGSLRTGWGELDKLMVLYSDDYPYHHTHWENNSIYFAMGGQWLIRDPGYGSIATGAPKTSYDMKYAVNSIYVDNKPQSVKDVGDISEIFNTELYGQIRGSAPDAFGKYNDVPILDRFDRDVIMLNHDSASYYIVIDDLASSQEHIYGWNMVFTDFDRMELDGEEWDYTQQKEANHFAMLKGGRVLHQYFVGESLSFFSEFFTKAGESYGPLFRANTTTASTSKQFMTIINAEAEYDGMITVDNTYLHKAWTSNPIGNNPDGFSWSSSDTTGQGIVRPLGADGVTGTMFRAGAVGDWMSCPFYIEEAGTYMVSLNIGYWNSYGGTWALYFDDQLMADNIQPRSLQNRQVPISFGEMELTAGKHMVKVVLLGDINPEGEDWGTLINIGTLLLEQKGASLGTGSVEVLESYDNENLIGATIRYGTVLKDMILSNKGTGAISAGKLSTNGKQAAVMGLYEDDIREGYSLLNGTSLKYGNTTLVSASVPMDVTTDFTMAKYPIKNTDDEDAYQAIIEEFNFKKLTTKLNVTAQQAGTLTFYVGTDTPYTVTVNDQVVSSTYADGMLTINVSAGTQNFVITGAHHCVFDQKVTMIPNVKNWAGCYNPTEYYVSCLCGANGTETFFDGEARGHEIGLVKAQEPTDTEDGWIEHYGCKNCDAVFADKDGKQPLTWDDVVIRHPVKYMWLVWVAVGVGGLLIVGTATILTLTYGFGITVFKKKKAPANDEPSDEPEQDQPDDSQ